MIVKEIEVKEMATKSNLPASDYVINPYVGCPHGCKYCYASFMKRFTGHKEEWGSFIDIKKCPKKLDKKKLQHKRIFLSSVTDCYNCYEKEYELTRKLLEQLVDIDCYVSISTKSNLILRDIDLLKKLKHLEVSISINTLDEKMKEDMDNASSIKERLETLKILHENGIYTILFLSPIFPYLTDFKKIIEISQNDVDKYWLENLNLRGTYKSVILKYIGDNFPQYLEDYREIYERGDKRYWEELSLEIEEYCKKNKICYTNFFYHEKLVVEKVEKK